MSSLVRQLFDGPIDIVGDVHGEIEALSTLLQHLGYDDQGRHRVGRRLIFVGDLTDRGPDSPRVVDLVQNLVESERAQCVLGNHDLNILLERPKPENPWYFGEVFRDEDGVVVPQERANDSIRRQIRDFFGTLPIALERDDVRVVHACWRHNEIEIVRRASGVKKLYSEFKERIDAEIKSQNGLKDVDQKLARQNRNPVKVLTSGPERRAQKPFKAGGKVRLEERVPWWDDYHDHQMCIFGHYGIKTGEKRGAGRAFCVDFGIAKRWEERRAGIRDFATKLAAFRMPEEQIVFDDGTQLKIDRIG
jgi:hypothetical protein